MLSKRFVLLTLDYPPETGGVARYLGELVEAAQGGIRVVVPEKHVAQGPGKVDSITMFRNRWPRWWPMVRICRDLQKEEALLVSHAFPVGTAALISKLLGGPEYLVLFHGLDLKLAFSPWKRFLLDLIIRHAKGVCVNSLATKKLLEEKVSTKKKVLVITPGIHPRPLVDKQEARQRLGLPLDKPVLLTVARFVPRKGIDVTIQALSRIQAEFKLTYAVIGSGTDRGRLEEIANKKRVEVTWASPATDEEKWVWYAACDAFVMPARETADDIEGFGIVYLEAAMASRPAIAGKSGGAKEAVVDGKTGLLVNEHDPEEVANAIRTMLTQPELAEKLGQAGRSRAEKEFTWGERWEKLKSLLE